MCYCPLVFVEPAPYDSFFQDKEDSFELHEDENPLLDGIELDDVIDKLEKLHHIFSNFNWLSLIEYMYICDTK